MMAYFTSVLSFIRVVPTSSEGGILGEMLGQDDDMVIGRVKGNLRGVLVCVLLTSAAERSLISARRVDDAIVLSAVSDSVLPRAATLAEEIPLADVSA